MDSLDSLPTLLVVLFGFEAGDLDRKVKQIISGIEPKAQDESDEVKEKKKKIGKEEVFREVVVGKIIFRSECEVSLVRRLLVVIHLELGCCDGVREVRQIISGTKDRRGNGLGRHGDDHRVVGAVSEAIDVEVWGIADEHGCWGGGRNLDDEGPV